MTELRTIYIVNHASHVDPQELQDVVEAVQFQVSRHFAPAHGTDARLILLPFGEMAPLGAWRLTMVNKPPEDSSDIGDHYVGQDGVPYAEIYVDLAKQDHIDWSITVSHEILEILANPYLDRCVMVPDTGYPRLPNVNYVMYFYEVCDPCQDAAFAYDITVSSGRTVKVSDFALESWFRTRFTCPSGTRFSFKNNLKGPLILAPGGYIFSMPLPVPANSWQRWNAPAGADLPTYPPTCPTCPTCSTCGQPMV